MRNFFQNFICSKGVDFIKIFFLFFDVNKKKIYLRNLKKVVVKMEKANIQAILKKEGYSKSKKMIELYNGGLEIAEIAKLMQVRYNFVYNVVSNFYRVNAMDLRTVQKESKKGAIVSLIKEGKTNVEISKELRASYNYVFNVRKQMESSKK